MPARSTVASVALTLGFHLAALTYGLFLLLVFCFTGSTVLLLLVCLLSGSSHGVRMFVAFLWRTEMRINALASREKPPRERRSPHPNDHRPQLDQEPAPAPQSQPQREVTATVMIASLIYFLLFKWILNIVFTAIPLLLWFIAVVQLLPADNSLGIDSFVGSDNTFAKLFTAVAFAFFAHQLGVSASRGLVFVSDKMTQFLFDTANASSDTASRAAATFQPMLFADGPGFAEMQPIQPNAGQYFRSGSSGVQEYGSVHSDDRSLPTEPDPRSSRPSRPSRPTALRQRDISNDRSSVRGDYESARPMTSLERESSLPETSRSDSEPMPPQPPPFAPYDPRFRRGVEEQEVQVCGLKIIVKKNHDREWHHEQRRRDHEWDHGRGGRGRPGRHGRDGSGGRGWDRDDIPFAQVVIPDSSSESFDAPYDRGQDTKPMALAPSAPTFPPSPYAPEHDRDRPHPTGERDVKPSAFDEDRESQQTQPRTTVGPAGSQPSLQVHNATDVHERLDDDTTSTSSVHSTAERGRDEPVVGAPGKSYKMASSDELEIDEDVDGDDLSEHEQHEINTAEIATESSDDMRTEKYVELKEREHYAHDINRTADENIGLQQSQLEKGKHHSAPEVLSANSRAATGRDIKRIKSSVSSTTSSHSRRRPIGIASDQELRFDSKSSSSSQDTVAKRDEDADQSVNFVTPSQAAPPMDLEVIDSEIYRAYGSVPRYDDDDVQHLRAFDPTADPERPLQCVSSIDVERRVRDIEYDSFSPMGTPTGFRTGNMVGSFISNPPEYDAMSPTNSIQDGEFPSEKFQQVYRSIRQPSSEAVSASRFDEMGFNDDVISRRDRVNFNAFAPPSVCPSVTPFIYSVWAFLLSQRAELHERVATELPEARKLSLDAKMDLRRGALVHVTLDVPSGFRILNGATQGFMWEGKLSNVQFEVACSEDAAIGPVLFKAKIVVGAEVAVLRSYVVVSSRKLDYRSNRDEPEMLDSSLEILEKSYEEIPYRSLELKELVGQGYFGDAYRALYNGEEVVVKTIRASEFGETSTQIVKEFQHEAAVLNMFGHHPCIVPFVGASTDDHFPLCLVTKYLPYGSLEDRLKHPTSESSYSVAQKTGMLKDAAAGLLNVHEGGFIHRDIAARNCLVDDDLRVRICDFGLCRRVMNESGSGLMRDAFGPVKYMAPESLQPPHVFSYSSDSYMFGVLMWETFSSSPPFPSMAPVEAMLRITRGERLAVPSSLPEELRLLMETCFRDEPTERPLMGEILQALDESFADMNRKASGFIAAGAAATASFSKNLSRRDRSIFA